MVTLGTGPDQVTDVLPALVVVADPFSK